MTGSITIAAEQNAVPVGAPFAIAVDLLNYGTGTFYFVTFAVGAASVYDHIVVLPGSYAPLATNVHGICSTNGALVQAFGASGPAPTVAPGEIYIAAVNIAQLKAFNNSLHVDFYDTAATGLLRADIQEVKLVRNYSFDEQLKVILSWSLTGFTSIRWWAAATTRRLPIGMPWRAAGYGQ